MHTNVQPPNGCWPRFHLVPRDEIPELFGANSIQDLTLGQIGEGTRTHALALLERGGIFGVIGTQVRSHTLPGPEVKGERLKGKEKPETSLLPFAFLL